MSSAPRADGSGLAFAEVSVCSKSTTVPSEDLRLGDAAGNCIEGMRAGSVLHTVRTEPADETVDATDEGREGMAVAVYEEAGGRQEVKYVRFVQASMRDEIELVDGENGKLLEKRRCPVTSSQDGKRIACPRRRASKIEDMPLQGLRGTLSEIPFRE